MKPESLALKITNRYIGVGGGYLGDFTYRSHADFYPEYCELVIDPNEFAGTTRERFIEIFCSVSAAERAQIVNGVIDRFPVGSKGAPETRTPELRDKLLEEAARLAAASPVASPATKISSPVVERAIADAEALLISSGATSGVDRIHTALHGYLNAACESAGIKVDPETKSNALLKILRKDHPKLQDLGPRSQDIEQVLNSSAGILNALNPLRNKASVAHPNPSLLDRNEAMLVINVARSLLHYLDAKLGE